MVPFWGRYTTHFSLFWWGLECSLGVRAFDPWPHVPWLTEGYQSGAALDSSTGIANNHYERFWWLRHPDPRWCGGNVDPGTCERTSNLCKRWALVNGHRDLNEPAPPRCVEVNVGPSRVSQSRHARKGRGAMCLNWSQRTVGETVVCRVAEKSQHVGIQGFWSRASTT